MTDYNTLVQKVKELKQTKEYCKKNNLTMVESMVVAELESALTQVKQSSEYQETKDEKVVLKDALKKLHLKQKEHKDKLKVYQQKFSKNATGYNKGKVKKYHSLLTVNRHEINKMNYQLKELV